MAKLDELTGNQVKALMAILAEPTLEQAAERCGLTERTLYNYLSDDAFKSELRARQDRLINAATAHLADLAGTALKTLGDIVCDPENAPGVRVRAALGILDHVQRLTTFADLAARVAALEER